MKLIPVDATSASELQENFAGSKFRSTEDFIQFYNSGLLNKGAEEVAEWAGRVDQTFKNVRLQGKNLVFISQAEVELDEVLHELRYWEILVRVKDRLEKLVEEGELTEDSVVRLDGGSLSLVASSGEGEETLERIEDRVVRPAELPLLEDLHRRYSTCDGVGEFVVRDLTSLDDSFISTVHATLFGG